MGQANSRKKVHIIRNASISRELPHVGDITITFVKLLISTGGIGGEGYVVSSGSVSSIRRMYFSTDCLNIVVEQPLTALDGVQVSVIPIPHYMMEKMICDT